MKLYPANINQTFEFNKIIELLEQNCISKLGKNFLSKIRFLNNIEKINELLYQTNEFKDIVNRKAPFPIADYIDITKELSLLKISNGQLKEQDFVAIKTVCKTIESVFQFFKSRTETYPKLELLSKITQHEPVIIQIIDAVIDADGTVKSSASVDLAKIRKALQKARIDADRQYAQLINKYRKQGYLTEDMEESVRNNRRVLIIDSSYKAQIKGIHHDISATGKATFIEPAETIDINNKIVELENDEQKEISKILKLLTTNIRVYSELLQNHIRLLGIFDYTRAKALLAIQMNANLPVISKNKILNLRDAYHPLLYLQNKAASKKTIPYTFSLDSKKYLLIISGPNAGGKTICMKAVGLILMMTHAGMLPPVHELSEIGIFNHLLVDMGDTQNMEFELSTYSSRLTNMNYFLKRAYSDTFVLIDEFGTGTDPLLGGALAESILEQLHNQKTFGIITTHYLNLKLTSQKLNGIENAAMSYDPEKLTPLFELKIGKPGSSFTFAVAEKIGLPKNIIEKAKSIADKSSIKMDDLLNKLESELQQAQKNSEQLSIQLEQAKANKEKYNELVNESKNNAFKDIIKQQKQKLQQLESLESRVNKMATGFLKSKTKDKINVVNQFIKSINFDVQKVNTAQQAKQKQLDDLLSPTHVNIGDVVRIKSSKMSGTVIQFADKKVHIQFGAIKTIAHINDIIIIG